MLIFIPLSIGVGREPAAQFPVFLRHGVVGINIIVIIVVIIYIGRREIVQKKTAVLQY